MSGFLLSSRTGPGFPSTMSPAEPAEASPQRLLSLDAFRGLVMSALLCGGILQSLHGIPGWNRLAVQNEHAAWVGCTLWDLIQPSFLFMVGAAMPFSDTRRAAAGESRGSRFAHLFLRSLRLILVGLLLDHVGESRIQVGFIRVLQQIAIASWIAFPALGRPMRFQATYMAVLLVAYQALWVLNPFNGPGGPWAMEDANLGAAFDRWMLGRNYSHHYVGLNAVPSAANLVAGILAGTWILRGRAPGGPSPRKVAVGLLVGGLAALLLGVAVAPVSPWIKRLWTPGFALFSAGAAAFGLGILHALTEVHGWRRWAFPLVVVGSNSLAAYVLANAFSGWFRDATRAWLSPFQGFLGPVGFPILQHLAFAVAAWLFLYALWRRRIFLRA